MNNLLSSLILFSAAFVAGVIFYLILSFLIKKWRQRPFLKELKVHLEYLKSPLRLLVPTLCVFAALPFLELPERILPNLNHALKLWLIALFSWLLIKVIHIARDIIIGRYDIDAKDNLRARRVYTQARIIERIVIAGVLIMAASFMLMTFPGVRQIGVSLLASAGIIGIILGFAAQKTLGNLIAGIQIAIAQPIRLDDVVIVENEWGWIEEITLIYVVVKIWDLRRLIVPISYFIEHPFQNWTRTSADLLATVFIYADYTVPVGEVRNALTRILEESRYWDKKVNVLQVTDAKEQTIELRALMSAADSPIAWDLRCEVREKLLEFLQKKYPQCLPRTRVELKPPKP